MDWQGFDALTLAQARWIQTELEAKHRAAATSLAIRLADALADVPDEGPVVDVSQNFRTVVELAEPDQCRQELQELLRLFSSDRFDTAPEQHPNLTGLRNAVRHELDRPH